MSTVQIHIDAPPERVFDVLADPKTYADWVVGSDNIRDSDPGWPAPGSRFHHRVGVPPLRVRDNTEVVESDPPHLLVLHARARPLLGTAEVRLKLEPEDGGTRVTMYEGPVDLLSRLVINPLTDRLIDIRNRKSLERLKRIAETGVVRA
jgi:uncharacterized protein YndB with AHSA1/START domain